MPALRDVAAALGLGIAALVLNQEWFGAVPLASIESPRFLFGGIFVFFAFASYGWRLGLLAALISVGDNLVSVNPPQLVMGIYVLEAVVAYAVFRRFGSMVLGVTVFWLGPGLVLDWILYKSWLGLSVPYVTILLGPVNTIG